MKTKEANIKERTSPQRAGVQQAVQFKDKREESEKQVQLQAIANNSVVQRAKSMNPSKGKKKKKKKMFMPSPIKQTMVVRNKTNTYSSGLINALSQAQGVEAGPRREAQKVARFFGGSWVGGHMVNDQLGGSGGFNNIVPITSSMNGLHRSIENKANQLLSSNNGTSIEYKMKILKRATVKNQYKTVKNLPVEFKQTLIVHPAGAAKYKIDGYILQETHPGNGVIQ